MIRLPRPLRSYGLPTAAHCARAALLLALASGCGPGAATPVPEPPALQGDKISIPPVSNLTGGSVSIQGAAGAAPPHSTILVTDLDGTAPPIATTVGANGGFDITLPDAGQDELRLVAVVDGVRSLPLDFTVMQNTIVPSLRPACLTVTPGLLVNVKAGDEVSFAFNNSCGGSVTVQAPRSRLGNAAVSFDAQFAAAIPSGASGTFSVRVGGVVTTSTALDEVVFVDVQVNGQSIRYPLGVYTSGG